MCRIGLTLILLLVQFLLSPQDHAFAQASVVRRAVQGVLDLRDLDLDQSPTVNLDGEWGFAWKGRVDPYRPSAYVELTKRWPGDPTQGGHEFGFAEYSLQVLLPNSDTLKTRRLSFFKPNTLGGAKWDFFILPAGVKQPTIEASLFPDYTLEQGKFSESGEDEIQGRYSRFLELRSVAPGSVLMIRLQLSNHAGHGAGVYLSPSLYFGLRGTEARDQRWMSYFQDIFDLGVIGIIALYHLILFLLRPEDRRSCAFGVLGLLIFIRTVSMSGLLYELGLPFSGFTEMGLNRVEYLTMPLLISVTVYYLHTVFPRVGLSQWRKGIYGTSLLLAVFTFLSSRSAMNQYLPVYQLHVVVGLVYALMTLGQAYRRELRGSRWMWAGMIPVMLTVVNDLLVANQVIYTPYLLHYGILSFIVAQSFLLAEIFAGAVRERDAAANEVLKTYAAMDTELLQREKLVSSNQMIQEEMNLTGSQLIQADRMASLGKLVAQVAKDIAGPAHLIQSGAAQVNAAVLKLETDTMGLLGPADSTQPEQARVVETLARDFSGKKRAVNDIKIGINRIHSINSAILNQSKPAEVEKAVSLKELIEECHVILNSKLKVLEFYNECPDSIRLDCRRSQIGQVLTNLISNSADAVRDTFTSGSGGKVMVFAKDLGNWVEISVEDNGPGVPDSLKQKILEPFFTTKSVGKGTGLGMPIVLKIVSEHGGKFDVLTSSSLRGAKMKFILPKWRRVEGSVA